MSPAEPESAEPAGHGEGDARALAPVILLRPIRTLVVARDLGFRQRALTVLGELGPVAFAVVSVDDHLIVDLVAQQRADVVVLDATACATAVPRVISALCEVNPHVGVVVISDQPDAASHSARSLPKWGWATDLTRAVMDAYRHGNPFVEELLDASI